jgi:hypothetical protein
MLIETILGAATGLIGNIVSGVFKYKTAQLELQKQEKEWEFKEKMVRAETEAMIQETKANIAIEKAKIEGEIEIADTNAYVLSQTEGNKKSFDNKWVDKFFETEGRWKYLTYPIGVLVASAFGFVDFLRGIMRPSLTAYLVGLTTYITILAWEVMEKAGLDKFKPEQAALLFDNVTNIIIYLTVSCVTWWFGDRFILKAIMDTQKKKTDKKDVTI